METAFIFPPFTALLWGWRSLLIGIVLVGGGAQALAEEGKEPLPGSVKIVFFVPADLAVPEGVRPRITKIADAADAFFFNGMSRHGYPAAVKTLFQREADGQVELLQVRGDEPVASGRYAEPSCVGYVINKAGEQYKVPRAYHVWWIFMYLGDRPTRFEHWAGRGNPRGGGWAMINYDTVPGDIRPDLQLTEGFNFEYKLKSTIHELAHGFGLPHMGPDPTLGLGNSLMGPNPPEYAARSGPKADHVYLAASEAAMLWKHPFFTGKATAGGELSEVKLADYKAAFDAGADTVTVSGKLVGKQPAHSVVLIDDRGEKSEYWSRSYAARLAPDGSFEIKVQHPARVDGKFCIRFCFESGLVSGNGTNIGPTTYGDVVKAYRFSEEQFQFQD
jgi:hypothetical protein